MDLGRPGSRGCRLWPNFGSGCGHPDEVGRVAAFLPSPAALYVDAVIMVIDGGMIRSLP